MAIAFIVIFLGLCIFINRRNLGVENFEDYATSSGAFGMIPIAFAIFATWYTGAVFTAYSDFSVLYGFTGSYVLPYTAIMLVFMYIISKRTYLWGKKYRIKTLAELMDLRFRSKKVRLLVGIVSIIFTAPWLMLEWVAQGYVFNYATNGALNPIWGMILGVIVVLVYVTTGGMKSVITANLLQGSYMFFIGVGLMFYLIYFIHGSFGESMSLLNSQYPDVLTFPGAGWEQPSTYWTSLIISSGLGALLWPFVFNKILAADSVKSVKQSTLLAPVLSLIFWAAFVFLGQSLHPLEYARENPLESYMWIAKAAGPLPLALMSTLIVMASISSVAGIVQSIASMISVDIAQVINRKISDRNSLRVARISVVVISIITLAFAVVEQQSRLIFLAILIYQGILVLFPILMLGLFWKRANKLGVIISILVGAPLSQYLTISNPAIIADYGWTGGMYAMIVVFAIMIVTGYMKPIEKHTEQLWSDIETAHNNVKNKLKEETAIEKAKTS